MALSVRQLIENLTTHGIIPAAELTSVRDSVAENQHDADCEQVIRELVKQGKLTKFQAMNLYQGRGRGLVFGEYVILDRIGAGGMGQVYKAQHRRMKRIVALKVLPPQAVKSQKSIQRFYQEVEVAAKLHHPNIVTAYDAGEAHGMHYLVMEFVDGKDLSSHIHKNGPLALEQTLNVALQTARGLAYAHELNIVHRDIKPSNLLVDRKGVVKILDMGLARVSNPIDDGAPGQELTADGEVMGTMDYMAPEQAMDTRNADHRADIYSLGCTIYRLYVNKAPYEGETAVQKILAHRDRPIPSLRAARPETPDMVDRLYQKMMAKNPAERIQSMSLVVQSIERMLSGVDDDRSSVMLGAETIDNDLAFLGGSGVGVGSASGLGLGSSLGGSSASGGLPGSSGININTSPQQGKPAAAAQNAPGQFPAGNRNTQTVTNVAAASTRDTDAIVRSIMQAKPAPPKEVAPQKKSSKMPLLLGGGVAAVALIGAVAFFLTRGKAEPPPPETPIGVKPVAATATADPVDVAFVPTPLATASATTNFTSSPAFFGPTKPEPIESQPVTADVDLLTLIDPMKHSPGSRWYRDGAVLVCDTTGAGVHLAVPFAPAGDYDLHCEVLPPAYNSQFGFGLPVGGVAPLVVVNQLGIGVHMVDGRGWNDAGNPTFHRESHYAGGKPIRVDCAVRGGRLLVKFDDLKVVDFTDDGGRFANPENFPTEGNRLYLNGSQGVRFTKLVVAPPTMSLDAQTLESEVDLLTLVDPDRHRQHGTWRRDGTVIECVMHSGPGPRVLVPFQPPSEYDLSCVVVPTKDNISFGAGLVVDGRNVTFMANDDKVGLWSVDNRRWSDAGNPTYRENRQMFFRANEEVRIVCSVRAGGRVFVTLNDRPVVDFRGDASRLSHAGELNLSPGQLHLFGEGGTRFTRLAIGPPVRSLAPAAATVNVAAAFDPSAVVEGIGAASRGAIILNGEANKFAKLSFAAARPENYAVTAVVERQGGAMDSLSLGLPFAGRRPSFLIDTRLERFVGLQFVNPGGVDINPTGRRYGYQLTPGELHVVRAVVTKDPKGWRVRGLINGREVLDYAGFDYNEDGGLSVPDPNAVSVVTWSSGWRIWRIDIGPADGSRGPVPETEERAAALASLAQLTAAADARTATAEDKLLAVDLLRQKAAQELANRPLRYAALDEALRIASSGGDLTGAFESAEDLCSAFDVDRVEVRARALEVFKSFRSTQTDAKKQFADEAFKLMDRAAKAEQWSYALELNSALDKFIGSLNAELKRELKARANEYEYAKSLEAAATGARTKLAAGEKLDPAEYTAWGKYLCFGIGDWPNGLQALAQGDDAGLRAVAQAEPDPKQPDSLSGETKFALAEKWWELSEKEKTPNLKWAEAERAAMWYRRSAAWSMNDKSRSLLPRRLTSIAQLRRTSGGAGGPRRPPDAVKIGNNWYKAFPVAMQWDAAVQTCELWGGNLAVIDSPQENDAVARLMLQGLAGQAAERCAMWMGASDVEQEGVFRRLDGLPLPGPPPTPGLPAPPPPPGPPMFAKWAGGEPNNGNGDEDFVYVDVSLQNGQVYTDWRDGPRNGWGCYFVCEWDH